MATGPRLSINETASQVLQRSVMASRTRPPKKSKKEIEKEKREAKRLERCDILSDRNDRYCFRLYSNKPDG